MTPEPKIKINCKMKVVRSIVLILISLAVVSSCFDPPKFPNRPKIRIQEIEFLNGPPLDADTIRLTLFFQDGDGDLGLRGDELDFPYHPYDKFLDKDGELINIGAGRLFSTKEPVEEGMKITRKLSFSKGISGMNDFKPPFDCINYRPDSIMFLKQYNSIFDETYDVKEYPVSVDGNLELVNSVKDTLYIQPNPNHYNIDVAIWVKCECEGNSTNCCPDYDGDGEADLDEDGYYEFRYGDPWPTCYETWNGRFPYVARDNESPTEGTIQYSINSVGFDFDLGLNTTIRLKTKIRDRAHNESNEVKSAPFTLAEKTRR
jgi:hypothetical protein